MLFIYVLIVVLSAASDSAYGACSGGGSCNTTLQSLDNFTFYCCNSENPVSVFGEPFCANITKGQGPFSDNTCATKGYATFAPPPPKQPRPPPSLCSNGAIACVRVKFISAAGSLLGPSTELHPGVPQACRCCTWLLSAGLLKYLFLPAAFQGSHATVTRRLTQCSRFIAVERA
jgi:hypothetical protein